MQFKELTNEEFINFTNEFNLKSIYQTPEYGLIMNNQNYSHTLVGLVENEKVIAASLILIKKENGFKYAYAPKGFLINYEDYNLLNIFTNNLKKYLSKKQVVAIKINPIITKAIYNFESDAIIENQKYEYLYNRLNLNKYYHLGYNDFFESLNPRFEAILDLRKPIETLFRNIKKEYKTKIRTCYKNGIRIYKGNSDIIEQLETFTNRKYNYNSSYFKDCYEYFSKRNMVDLYYCKIDTQTYLKNIQDKLSSYEEKSEKLQEEIMKKHKSNPINIINKKINVDKYINQYKSDLIFATNMLKTNPNGIITAAILTIKQNKDVTILIDSYDKRFKKLNSKHLLVWQLIEIYKKQGFEKFNLGGLSNISTKNNKYDGLNEFKTGFGTDVYEYAGDFELITNTPNYELYRNLIPLSTLIKNKLK